jgi:hypothetical protein
MTTTNQSEEKNERQSVIVSIKMTGERFGTEDERDRLEDLEDRLDDLLDGSDVGELDGNEVGMGFWTLYFYVPDANALWDAIQPTIRDYGPPTGSYVEKRYGGPDDAEETFEL